MFHKQGALAKLVYTKQCAVTSRFIKLSFILQLVYRYINAYAITTILARGYKLDVLYFFGYFINVLGPDSITIL